MPSWGMILEPKKRYKQNVQNAYQITHAVLDLEAAGAKGQHSDVLMTIGENTFILCTLSTGTPQTQLNMRLAQGDQISFATRGEGTIHLTGYILEAASTAVATLNGLASGDSKKAAKNQKNSQKKDDLRRLLEKTLSDEDDESDDEDFNDLMRSMDGLEEDDDSGEEEEDDDEMGDDSDDDEEGDEDDSDLGEEEEDDDDDDDDEDDEVDSEEEQEVKEPPTKKGKKEPQPQQQQKNKQEQKPTKQDKKDKKEKPAATAAAQTNGVAKDGKVQTLGGGVKIKDLREGSGAPAKPGKNVVVYYEGRLQSNNKMFDSCKQGAGFKFQLGRGTVIRGWDIGVAGMKVGGKRQITCPPGAAYGQRGSPPVIPPNSTLVFDVELRNVQ